GAVGQRRALDLVGGGGGAPEETLRKREIPVGRARHWRPVPAPRHGGGGMKTITCQNSAVVRASVCRARRAADPVPSYSCTGSRGFAQVRTAGIRTGGTMARVQLDNLRKVYPN